MKGLKVKIKNDTGFGKDTQITDAETGELISLVRRVKLDIEHDELVTCEMETIATQLDIDALLVNTPRELELLKKIKQFIEKVEGQNGT